MERTLENIRKASEKLDAWIEQEGYKGFDPHDALNSQVLRSLCLGSRISGILPIQVLKRCPVNLRPLLGIKKGYNPKGMGLFLSSYMKKYQTTGDRADLLKAEFFIGWLKENASTGYAGYCWGYNFDWMNRSFSAPAGTPTVVNSSFIASAFIDAYKITRKNEYLDIARSTCDFFLNDLNVVSTAHGIYFSYTPLDKRCVHNATALAAATLAKVYYYTNETELIDYAKNAMGFVVNHQHSNGSWSYGEGRTEGWVDNYHTGFVLEALADFIDYSHLNGYMSKLELGYRFFKENFFLQDGRPKYYHDQIYPIDIHSVAQAILTFLRFHTLDRQAVERAKEIALWGIENMQDSSGYFYYQIHRTYRNKIPYIRWGQAWMQRALTELLMDIETEREGDSCGNA